MKKNSISYLGIYHSTLTEWIKNCIRNAGSWDENFDMEEEELFFPVLIDKEDHLIIEDFDDYEHKYTGNSWMLIASLDMDLSGEDWERRLEEYLASEEFDTLCGEFAEDIIKELHFSLEEAILDYEACGGNFLDVTCEGKTYQLLIGDDFSGYTVDGDKVSPATDGKGRFYLLKYRNRDFGRNPAPIKYSRPDAIFVVGADSLDSEFFNAFARTHEEMLELDRRNF